jgi:hypothetical protein
MSSSAATKFQDHYLVLDIDPSADADVIQKAFQEQKAKYDPANTATADAEKYEAVHVAYEVLSEPSLRRAFDRLKGVNQNESDPKFSGPGFFDALGHDNALRVAILCVLYDRRRTRPYTPTLSMRALENILAASNEEVLVALWYLKQRHMVINDDKSSLQITVDGMDFLEKHQPSADVIMPFLKPAFVEGASIPEPEPAPVAAPAAAPPPPPPAAPPAPTPKPHESVLSVLHRALARA